MRIFSVPEAAGLAFFWGFLLGSLVTIGVALFIDPIYQESLDALAKCEANLPRTEHCVITAIPAARPADGAE